MYIDFYYDGNGEVERVFLEPEKHEDPDVLHNYAMMLKVINPLMQYEDALKAGKHKRMKDDDRSLAAVRIKEFDRLFFHNSSSVNIFRLLADMTEYIFQNHCFTDTGKGEHERETEWEMADGQTKTPWDACTDSGKEHN